MEKPASGLTAAGKGSNLFPESHSLDHLPTNTMVDTAPPSIASIQPPRSLSAVWADLKGTVELRIVRRALERPLEPDTLTLLAPARIIQGVGELVDSLAEISPPPTGTTKSPLTSTPLQARALIPFTRTTILTDSDGDGIIDFVTNRINPPTASVAVTTTSSTSQPSTSPAITTPPPSLILPAPPPELSPPLTSDPVSAPPVPILESSQVPLSSTPSPQHTISTLTVSSVPKSDSGSAGLSQTTFVTVTVVTSTYFSIPATTETQNSSQSTPETINKTTAIIGGVVLTALTVVGVILFICCKYCIKNKPRFIWNTGRKKKPGGNKPLIDRGIAGEGGDDKEKGGLDSNGQGMSPRPSIQLVTVSPSIHHQMELDRIRSIDSQYPRVVRPNPTNSSGLQQNPRSAAIWAVGESSNLPLQTGSPVYNDTLEGNTGIERSSALILVNQSSSQVGRIRLTTEGAPPHPVGTPQPSITGGRVSVDPSGALWRTISSPRKTGTTTTSRSQLGCTFLDTTKGEFDGTALCQRRTGFEEGSVITGLGCDSHLPQSLEQRACLTVGQEEDASGPLEKEFTSELTRNYNESNSAITVLRGTDGAYQNFCDHQFEGDVLRWTSQATPRLASAVSHTQVYSYQSTNRGCNDINTHPFPCPPDTIPRAVRVHRSISPPPSILPGPERRPSSVMLTLVPGRSTPATVNIILDGTGDSGLSIGGRSSWTINPPQTQSSGSGSSPLTPRQSEVRANTGAQINAVQRSSPLESLIRTHSPYPEHSHVKEEHCGDERMEWDENNRVQAVSAWIQAAPSVWDDPDLVSVEDGKTEFAGEDGENIAEGFEEEMEIGAAQLTAAVVKD